MIRAVARKAVHVEARRVAEQGGEGQGAFFNEFRHDAGDIRVQVNESLVHVPEQRQSKHGLADRSHLEQHVGIDREVLPEAAVAMLENQGMQAVDKVLQSILDLYELDFAKYADPREIPRIHAIWHSLPAQLGKENRKFIYKVIKTGARSKDYEDALLWLEDAGVIYRINNISKPGLPIKAYEDSNAFKVYACDCGLLRRLAHLPANAILDTTSNYTEFKGAMAENAVL